MKWPDFLLLGWFYHLYFYIFLSSTQTNNLKLTIFFLTVTKTKRVLQQTRVITYQTTKQLVDFKSSSNQPPHLWRNWAKLWIYTFVYTHRREYFVPQSLLWFARLSKLPVAFCWYCKFLSTLHTSIILIFNFKTCININISKLLEHFSEKKSKVLWYRSVLYSRVKLFQNAHQLIKLINTKNNQK